jgi:hypothetical protein
MRLSGIWVPLYVFGLIAFFTALAPAAQDELTTTVTIPLGDVSIERVQGYDVVRMNDGVSTSEPGYPELPFRLVRFALPDGMAPAGVEARVESQTELPGDYLVRPRQPEVPLSMPELAQPVGPNEAAYASELPYPGSTCELLGYGNAGGQGIATVAYYPVQYVPGRRKIIVSERADITLRLEPSRVMKRMPGSRSERAAEVAADRVRSIVINPEDVPVDTGGPRADRGEVDYLIITSPSYESQFQTLADWKSQKALTTDVVTTSWIYANYPGVDEQEQIRNCIIDYYENKGTLWVLLGGDTGVVPARIVYAMTSGAGGGPDEDKIRCDLYYGDLDGNWNADGNSTYGQNASDEVDMYADVFVGRAPVDNVTEAARFVNKTLTYEGAPGGDGLPADYQLDLLFMAEVLWTSPWTDGGVCKDMIDDDSVPAKFDPITKLYQTSGNLSTSSALAAMNEGQNIVNHMGHANTTVLSIGGGALYRSSFDNLNNAPRYGLFYSIGCWSAAIDYDCIGEHWDNSPNGGGFAYVGNSRYGWGSPGNPGYGTSDRFDREFFKVLFEDGLEHLGAAHAAHKDAFADAAHMNGYTRYVLYELNLLGDPETSIWTSPPVTATVGRPASIPLGEHQMLVTVQRDGEAVGGATVYVTDGTVTASTVAGPDGVASLVVAPVSEGTMTVMVTGQGILPYETTVPVIDQAPDVDAPGPVEALTLADPFDLGGEVLLDWSGYTPPADFAQYRIYRDTAPFEGVAGMDPIATNLLGADARSWTDTTVENGQSYYYAITAVDLAANEGAAARSSGPIAASVNSRILLWDADDGDMPFDGNGDDFSDTDGTEVPWIEALDASGELYTVSETLPDDLSPFELIIYLGGYVNFGVPEGNIPLTDDEAAALTAFVDAGGDLYVEEPMFGGTYYVNGSATAIGLWNRFHSTYATGQGSATGNVESLSGQSGRLTQDMDFDYDYQGAPDHFVGVVGPNGDAGTSSIWHDEDAEARGSLYEDPVTGSRRYMVPVMLGGLSDTAYPSTRIEYVTRILEDSDLIGTTGVDDALGGDVNALWQNAPNPFNPVTSIRYSVARAGARVTLRIYDVSGRVVATLCDGPSDAGEHVARWNGRDDTGRYVASGVYFSKLSVDGWNASRKMVLLK